MLLLAFDTSTRQASIALCSEHELLSEYTWSAGNNHSVDLFGHIQRIIDERQITLQQLDGVVVATGPGSFNGLRVALATAKALAFSLQKPLIGISTLELIAARQRDWRGPVCALLEAGRSELYAACYLFETYENDQREVNYRSQQVSDYLTLTPQHLAAHLQEHGSTWHETLSDKPMLPFLLCGEIHESSRQVLRHHLGDQGVFVNAPGSVRHASLLAQLAFPRLAAGQVDDALSLEPLYLRRPSITKSTRKQPLFKSTSQRPDDQDMTEREEGAIRH